MPNDRVIPNDQPAPESDWGTLAARTIDDLTRILQSEIRLFTASIRLAIEQESDRVMVTIAAGAFAGSGLLVLVASLVLFLREYAGLAWWQSFGIVGAIMLAAAAILARTTFVLAPPRYPVDR